MIKAVLGGGGKGMRIANSEDDFLEMLDSAKSEAAKSFGDNQVILEKYIERSRYSKLLEERRDHFFAGT
jgi:3-methylcrotonyl-CoA carboxylase alpha subunit